MSTESPTIVPLLPETSLAALASHHAAASRVFQRHQLDFCCQGARSLAAACREQGVDADAVLAELRAAASPSPTADWTSAGSAELIEHIVRHFHEDHRAELPRLLAMAEKVERVHAGRTTCPTGLAQYLHEFGQRLDQHMQKEEQVLFPLLRQGADAPAPIHCMLAEHDEHAVSLRTVRALAHDFVPPAEACGTWRALYKGLEALERMVMEHVHLENHVLFPRHAG